MHPAASCARGAQAAVDPPHFTFEAVDSGLARAISGSGTPRAVLVEHIREQILLLVREAVQECEEMRLVSEDHLRRDCCRRRRFTDGECTCARAFCQGLHQIDEVLRNARVRIERKQGLVSTPSMWEVKRGTYRYERGAETGQFFFQHFCRQSEEELAQRDESKRVCAVPNLRRRTRWERCILERTERRVQCCKAIHRLNTARERIAEEVRCLHHLFAEQEKIRKRLAYTG